MADSENHVSMLPQPKRSLGVMGALSELNASDNNSRNVMQIPAAAAGHKRQGSALPEPASKRKTLVERAGEPMRSFPAAPRSNTASILPPNSFSTFRSASNTSSTSYRSASISSRQTSNSSFTGAVGSGIRPPTQSIARPKTALAKDKQTADARPKTSHGHHAEVEEATKLKQALDAEEHYSNFKRMFEDYQVLYKQTLGEVHEAKNANHVYTSTIEKLEQERMSKTDVIISLTSENETLKYRLEAAERSQSADKENEERRREMLRTSHAEDMKRLKNDLQRDVERIQSDHREELRELKSKLEIELEEERSMRVQALSQISTQGVIEKQKAAMELEKKDREISLAKEEVQRIIEVLEREKATSQELRKTLADNGAQATSMEATRQALQAKIEYLESDSKSQSESYADMERRMNAAFLEAEESKTKLRKEETLRRKLHNQVQELKGNIRVFCRVRPTLPLGEAEELAQMAFPDDEEDCKDISVRGQEEKSSQGKDITKTHPFSFDRVFNPTSNNNEIFEEISQLIQSALDGFNVCIFAYGQTGSGKTYTMSSDDGMIPRALRQIYTTSKELEERGWSYGMEGSFVEVYNEEIRDLLGNSKDGETKKHEIRHDMQKCETTITDAVTINLDSQEQVEGILEQAMAKRSVAATSANERSSRSHSVFILKLNGYNSITGERSKGTLNLVDLAGSERLSHSKVEGQRLKETQSINKSLSCLGDVIGALGQQGTHLSAFDPKASVNGSSSSTSSSLVGAHIPYRNSKLTYLLQFSLGGNSKTLMFVMVAPEKKSLGETLSSLKFADKVSRTRIGVAKKVR